MIFILKSFKMRTIVIDKKLTKNIDHNKILEYLSWNELGFFIFVENSPYMLLASISQQLNNTDKISDLGTFLGNSASSWSYNDDVKVETYDIDNNIDNNQITIFRKHNITFINQDVFLNLQEICKSTIIYLDIGFDKDQLVDFYDKLLTYQFKGLLILNHLHFSVNSEFFTSISKTKYNLSIIDYDIGIVNFDDTNFLIEFVFD